MSELHFELVDAITDNFCHFVLKFFCQLCFSLMSLEAFALTFEITTYFMCRFTFESFMFSICMFVCNKKVIFFLAQATFSVYTCRRQNKS